MTLEIIATITATITAAIALGFNAFEIRRSQIVTEANNWLVFRELISKYDDVHINLRPGGEWSESTKGPTKPEQWSRVESYMGLFEHANIMLNKKLLDTETFKKIYRYRLNNLLNNNIIVKAKLIDNVENWQDFIELCNKVGLDNILKRKDIT